MKFGYADQNDGRQTYRTLDPNGASTVGVRVTRGDRQEFKSLPWFQLERAKLNPLTKLIDDTIAAVSR